MKSMNTPKNFYDIEVLNKVFYNDKSKLSTRIDIWNKYGMAKKSYRDFLLSILDKQSFDGYIDIGCGNAKYSSEILKYVSGNAYFCDISKSLIEEAKLNTKNKSNCECIYINDDISQINIPKHSCELISLMHVLHHIDNIDAIFDKVESLAKDNARILITTYEHSLKDYLNVIHYEALEKFKFPQYMMDKEQYLKFNGDRAYQYLNNRFNKVEKHDYFNDALMNDPQIVLDYYTSAMMYRLSKGGYSTDISKDQWQCLYDYVKAAVIKEIKENKQIVLEGHLVAFWVRLE